MGVMASVIKEIAQDVSIFAPQPVSGIAQLLARHADLLEATISAIEGGHTGDELTRLIEQAIKAASDEQMRAELKP